MARTVFGMNICFKCVCLLRNGCVAGSEVAALNNGGGLTVGGLRSIGGVRRLRSLGTRISGELSGW